MWINWLVITAWNVLAGGLSLAFVVFKIWRSGTTARPVMVPLVVVRGLHVTDDPALHAAP